MMSARRNKMPASPDHEPEDGQDTAPAYSRLESNYHHQGGTNPADIVPCELDEPGNKRGLVDE